ncbi:two-component sensor kinase [Escherichia coli]|uniref:Two-component sensor kinase n=1 Tax=Escherichia coli TaxID=562 RepID=A0A376LK20_ECOLX|nr:two-component sensor kinase [Escherichia coli]
MIALRELALRRTADRVDEQMRAWRGHPGEEKAGTHATRSFYASGITPAVRNWSARRRGWPRA